METGPRGEVNPGGHERPSPTSSSWPWRTSSRRHATYQCARDSTSRSHSTSQRHRSKSGSRSVSTSHSHSRASHSTLNLTLDSSNFLRTSHLNLVALIQPSPKVFTQPQGALTIELYKDALHSNLKREDSDQNLALKQVSVQL